MEYVGMQMHNWEKFTVVYQDQPGIVVRRGKGGLFTRNLMNCMCLILSNAGERGYGMAHISPVCPHILDFVRILRDNLGATHAIVTGANYDQDQKRIDQLADLLKGLIVVDETRSRWVPSILTPTHGLHMWMIADYAALNASNGHYALNPCEFTSSTGVETAGRSNKYCNLI